MLISLLIVAISYTTNCINVSQTHLAYARAVLFLVHFAVVKGQGIVRTIYVPFNLQASIKRHNY